MTSTSTSDELDPLRFCLQRIGFRGLSLALELAGLFSISAFLLPGHLLQDCDWVDQHSALRPARVLCYLQRLLIIDEPIDGVHFMALQSGRVSNELKESEISTRELSSWNGRCRIRTLSKTSNVAVPIPIPEPRARIDKVKNPGLAKRGRLRR